MAHFHGAHGQFSGSGYKLIDVEGQKFRVLLGSDAEEIKQWRLERKKKFPTASNVERKEQCVAALKEAGGIDSAAPVGASKRSRVQVSGEADDGRDKKLAKTEDAEDAGVDQVATGDGADKRSSFPCKYNYKGKTCSKGDSCPYSHTAEPLICHKFLSTGRCSKGVRCMFVHDKKANKATPKTANGDEQPAGASGTKRGQLYLPDPRKGNLLKKLLDDEINNEENLLLQCLHYLRKQNYLQDEVKKGSSASR